MGVSSALLHRTPSGRGGGGPSAGSAWKAAVAMDSPVGLDDAELARRVARGDRHAASTLVQRYQAMVRSFLGRLTGSSDLADDLAQETFIRLLRYAGRYDPGYPMRTWLLTIARRLSINHGRRADSRIVSTQYLGMSSAAADPSDDAERNDSRRALGQRLDAALQQLTEPQRVTLVMFHQQDLSIDQIAQALGMPTGTVKSHLHRGRAAMRRALGHDSEVHQS